MEDTFLKFFSWPLTIPLYTTHQRNGDKRRTRCEKLNAGFYRSWAVSRVRFWLIWKKKKTKNKIIKQSKHFRRYSNLLFYILLSEWPQPEVVSNEEVNFNLCGETFLSVRTHFKTDLCLSQCFIIQFVCFSCTAYPLFPPMAATRTLNIDFSNCLLSQKVKKTNIDFPLKRNSFWFCLASFLLQYIRLFQII